MHEQIHTIFYLLYSQQNILLALLCSASKVKRTFVLQLLKVKGKKDLCLAALEDVCYGNASASQQDISDHQ